jgi:hypothetical protein
MHPDAAYGARGAVGPGLAPLLQRAKAVDLRIELLFEAACVGSRPCSLPFVGERSNDGGLRAYLARFGAAIFEGSNGGVGTPRGHDDAVICSLYASGDVLRSVKCSPGKPPNRRALVAP